MACPSIQTNVIATRLFLIFKAQNLLKKNERYRVANYKVKETGHRIDNTKLPITVSFSLFYTAYLDDSAMLQCGMGVISEVDNSDQHNNWHCQSHTRVFVTVSLLCNPILSFFSKRFLCFFSITFCAIKI